MIALGTTSSVRMLEKSKPEMIAKPSGPHVGSLSAKGRIPATVVSVVRTMGWNLDVAASFTASSLVMVFAF